MIAKTTVSQLLIETLYFPISKYIQDGIDDIISINNTNTHVLSILHKGYTLTHSAAIDTTIRQHIALLPISTLIPKVENIIAKKKELDEERSRVTRFISIVLSEFDSWEDLTKIFGESLMHSVYKYKDIVFIGEHKPHLNDFIHIHQKEIDTIKQRLFENILMGDIYATTQY